MFTIKFTARLQCAWKQKKYISRTSALYFLVKKTLQITLKAIYR